MKAAKKKRAALILLSVITVAVVMTVANLLVFVQLRDEAKRQAEVHVESSLRLFWYLVHAKGGNFRLDRGRLMIGDYPIDGACTIPDEVLAITGNRATILKGDTRVATTLEGADGRRIIGTKLTGPAYDALFRNGVPYRGVAHVLGIPYVTAYDPIKDEEGKTIGALAVRGKSDEDAVIAKIVAINIAEAATFLFLGVLQFHARKRADEAMEKQFRFLQVLIDTIPSPIFVKDAVGRYCECNKAFEAFVRMERATLMGQTVHELWPSQLAQEYHRMDQELLDDGGVQCYECSVRSSDGTDRDVIFHKAVFRDHAGSPAGIVGVILDITERRRQERALREAQSDLMYASRRAGMAETATIVLHNVGNVLNSVNVSADLISQRIEGSKAGGLGKAVRMMREHGDNLASYLATDEKGRLLPEYLAKLAEALEGEHRQVLDEVEVLVRSVEHIKQIVATQQSFTGATSIIERVAVGEVIRDALRMHAGSLAGGGVSVEERIEALPEIPLDRTRVLQILVNLVGNAAQAVAAVAGEGGRITVSAGVAPEGGLRISVADNGIGIPAENLTRIFNHGFTTRKDGHGFGLHSCALAAKDMGGSLTVSSNGPGTGATFSLELPL